MSSAQATRTLVPLFDRWREQNAHLFHSEPSLRWYVRRHSEELVRRGALIRHRDTWMAVEPAMSRAVFEIGRAQAKQALPDPSSRAKRGPA